MTASVTELTHSYLLSILSYNPNSGEFRWKVSRGRVKAGYIAGNYDTHGYRQILIDKVPYLAGRLAWFYMKGVWPEEDICPKDGNRANTAWDNLIPRKHGEKLQQRNEATGYAGQRKGGKARRVSTHV